MNLTEKHVAGLTLKMLSKTGNLGSAKECALEGLYSLAERDLEWVNFVKEKYGIDIDYVRIKNQYQQAEVVIKNY